ncbi:MAG: DUF998 domain-containing protein [Saprospiraceae bacterium]|nr:DUF998 domain-containing protein [Saprospiraceae bacterium]
MQKTFYLILLLFATLEAFSQESLPTIRANSLKVDIRVDEDYFAKGGWTLDPTKRPDIFSIGSKWLYETKKVTFITDIDSISVNIHPNGKFNFIALLNEKTPCYIQIATLSNPIFMSQNIVFPILLGLTLLIIILYLFRSKINTLIFLSFGYALPFLFWFITFLGGAIHGNYNHFKNAISELGAIETKSEVFTSSALIVLAILSIFFSIGFFRASQRCKISVIPAALSFAMPITMIWAGIFTLGNELHSLTGPLPFLIILGFLLSYQLWKRNKVMTKVGNLSLLSFTISALILLRFIKPFGYEYEGLIQRFFYLAWTIWTISITHYLSKIFKEEM